MFGVCCAVLFCLLSSVCTLPCALFVVCCCLLPFCVCVSVTVVVCCLVDVRGVLCVVSRCLWFNV